MKKMDRIGLFKADANDFIKSHTEADEAVSKDFVFSDFVFDEEECSLAFRWTSKASESVCCLNYFASADYPDNGFLCLNWGETGKDVNRGCHGRLQQLLETVGKELLSQVQMSEDEHESDEDAEDMSSVQSVGNPESIRSVSEGPAIVGPVSPMKRRSSECPGNPDSECVDYDSDECFDEGAEYDYYDFDPAEFYEETSSDIEADQMMVEEEIPGAFHPVLRQDIQNFRSLLEPFDAPRIRKQIEEGSSGGKKPKVAPLLCISRWLKALDEVDCEIHMPLDDLNITLHTANAWGLNLDESLIIRINLSPRVYLDVHEPPKIEVFQVNHKGRSITKQLKNIITLFLSQIWKKVDNNTVQAQKKSISVPCDLSLAAGGEAAGDVDLQALQHLMEMGFDLSESRQALVQTKNHLMEASLLLAASASEDAPEEENPIPPCKKMLSSPGKFPEKKETKPNSVPKRINSSPEKHHGKKMKNVRRSLSTSTTEPSISEDTVNPFMSRSSTFVDAKVMPSMEDGFLVMLYRYIRQRVPTVSEFCVICDNYHLFHASGAMLKPSVCSRELCLFSFQTLGVMGDAVADIATDADVVDLLIAMAKAACYSNRKTIIFEPYPNIVDPDSHEPGNLALSDKKKDYSKVEKLLKEIPPMGKLLCSSSSDLQKFLDKKNRLLFPLLSWIITSNRSHIMKLPQDKQLGMMSTPHQFILLSSPPAQEKKFQEAKLQFGSVFAFHGSEIENWHSIIRKGLIVASGTKYQVNGAASGKGIYLSPLASISASYAKMGYGQLDVTSYAQRPSNQDRAHRFLQEKKVTCMALCEVIKSNSLKQHGNIWVCNNADHVCTRFFFLFEEGQTFLGDVSMSDEKHRKVVEQALADCFMAVVPAKVPSKKKQTRESARHKKE